MSAGKVTVVGAGTMGHGIAYVAALAGFEVCLTDSRAEALPRALGRLNDLLAVAAKRGTLAEPDRVAAAGRLRAEHQLAPAVSGADLVIEAVHEHLGVKQQLFAELERAAPPDALLATNTSSLSVADIAAAVQEPGRVVGMHFFNPVHAMKLVEVVTHPRAAPTAVERAVALARALGKEPIVVRDSPGFASSRLGLALGLEAMRMLERGVASAEDIDKAMELGYNHPMGPLKLTDLVGLDVRLAIAEYLHQALEEPQFEPPQILRDKVAKGELGKKSGKGFYAWTVQACLAVGALVLGSACTTPAPQTAPQAQPKVVAYLASWGVRSKALRVADIPGDRLTHIFYAFGHVALGGDDGTLLPAIHRGLAPDRD